MNFFDKANETMREMENSIVNMISTFAPWLAPLAPAFMTYQHAINPDTLKFPTYIAFPVALVVEILGFSAVSTFMSFWFYNRRNRAETKKAPLALIVVAFSFYLALILFSNVLLDAFPDEKWTLVTVRALYTLQTIPAALIVAVRTQHRDMLSEIAKEKSERDSNKPTENKAQSDVIPSNAPQQKKPTKIESGYLFISNYYAKNRQLPTNQTIANGSNVSLGTAHKARATFVVQNQDELLSAGAIDQEELISANTTLGQAMKQQEQTEKSAKEVISEFISASGKFPNTDDLANLNVSTEDAVRYVVEEQDYIRQNGLLPEETIQQAIQRYNQ